MLIRTDLFIYIALSLPSDNFHNYIHDITHDTFSIDMRERYKNDQAYDIHWNIPPGFLEIVQVCSNRMSELESIAKAVYDIHWNIPLAFLR